MVDDHLEAPKGIPKCIPKNPQSYGPLNVTYRSCSKNFTQILTRRHDWCIKLSKDHGNLLAFSCCLTWDWFVEDFRLLFFLTQLAMGNTTSDAAANQPTPLLKKGGQDRNNIMVSWTDLCYFFASLERRNFFFFEDMDLIYDDVFFSCTIEIHASPFLDWW